MTSSSTRPDDADGDSPCSSASMTPDQTDSPTSSSPKDHSERRRRGRPRLGEEPTHHSLKICILELPSQTCSQRMCSRNPPSMSCSVLGSTGGRLPGPAPSTFPPAGENKQFNIFKSDRSRDSRGSSETITPEEIYRSMNSPSSSTSQRDVETDNGDVAKSANKMKTRRPTGGRLETRS
ncbi:hypothetical protein INR49_008367 [Caranx melampygus]|nr:hypothetical protein INR49_008367 [Caranx melampygus]